MVVSMDVDGFHCCHWTSLIEIQYVPSAFCTENPRKLSVRQRQHHSKRDHHPNRVEHRKCLNPPTRICKVNTWWYSSMGVCYVVFECFWYMKTWTQFCTKQESLTLETVWISSCKKLGVHSDSGNDLRLLARKCGRICVPKTNPLVLGGGDTLLKHMSIGIRKFHLLGLKIDEHRVSLEEPKNPWFIAGL